jgi:hypothetical protein
MSSWTPSAEETECYTDDSEPLCISSLENWDYSVGAHPTYRNRFQQVPPYSNPFLGGFRIRTTNSAFPAPIEPATNLTFDFDSNLDSPTAMTTTNFDYPLSH